MLFQAPTLYLVCGKIAAGKSTLAAELANKPGRIMISEDHWLSQLYGDQMSNIDDYVRCSEALSNAMYPHIVSLLNQGLSVVLDFPANTRQRRQWIKNVLDESGAHHELHFLDVSDDECKRRLSIRNDTENPPFQPSEAEFDLFTKYFEPPSDEEGFNIVYHSD